MLRGYRQGSDQAREVIDCLSGRDAVREQLGEVDYDRIIFREMDTNDTWARDHGGISVFDEGTPMLYDFVFNGWGMKFAANHDNLITRNLCHMKTFSDEVVPANMQPFVLEGGSIESDGKGTLMTTVECLASVNRNEYLQQEELERYLKDIFGWIVSFGLPAVFSRGRYG